MHEKTLRQLAHDLQTKQYSAAELAQLFLQRIERFESQINAFITVDKAQVMRDATIADQLLAQNKHGPLTGIPLAHKDIFCTAGIKTSCGSKMLDNFIAPYDATVVSKLKAAGMVMLGKTNMDEFAMGSSNENSYYGACKNPWDIERIPGGSSGGSAAAVAARMAPVATGTDTGGSIRQPASMCGVSGLKPTYGRISRYGMIAFASSLDQGGIFANYAEDIALLLNAMAGYDSKDSTSIDCEVPDYTRNLGASLKGLKVGLPKQFFSDALQPAIGDIIHNAAKTLEQCGAILTEVDLPSMALSIPAYYVIAPAECSSNLARYDGVRYGYRCEQPKNLDDLYKRSRSEAFGSEVKRRIMLGTYVLSAGYYDAYYLKAQKIRSLIQQEYRKVFNEVDILLGPTAPTTAFKIGEKSDDPVNMYLSDIYTISVNLAGLPGMSIPAGFHGNLPVGLQLIGNHFAEARLLNVAHRFQQATEWHLQMAEAFN